MKNSLIIFCNILLLVSCVNTIDTEEELVEGNIPISLATRGETQSGNGMKFSKGDVLGLYATLSSSSLKNERYIDNLKMISDGNNGLQLSKEICYPEGDASIDFTAYYPYKEGALPKNSTKMSVSLPADQQQYESYASSDFLVAEKQNVKASNSSVELEFKHKCVKVNIKLKPGKDTSLDELLKSKPEVEAIGFATIGEYDFTTKSFSISANTKPIIPYGKWKSENGVLVGKEFIVLPQTLKDQEIILEWNGDIYTCPFPDKNMTSGTICEVHIELNATEEYSNALLTSKIEDWNEAPSIETQANAIQNAIHTSILSFDYSDVYQVYENNQVVAEICKEYLYEENVVDACAIVAYPVKNGITDLQAGLVLELFGNNKPVHGGKVSWSTIDNSLSYTAGTSNPIETIYIDKSNNITTTLPDDVLGVKVNSYILRDVRGSEEVRYPVIKIATQYWMKEDLRTNKYNDGTTIDLLNGLNGTAGYYYFSDSRFAVTDAYYYSGETLLAGSMAPSNWHVSTESDWERLKNYLDNDASKIKGGAWAKIGDNNLESATNETGLSILPNGLYIQDKSGDSYVASPTTYAAYWMCASNQQTLASQVMLFSSKDAGFELKSGKVSGKDYYQGLSIRCVKDMPY